MPKEYQSEKSPIIDSQKSKKTRRKLLKMSHIKASKVDQMFCNTLYIMVSSPIGLSEFWESEPMWICKNINSIHDQGRRYHYFDDRRSK